MRNPRRFHTHFDLPEIPEGTGNSLDPSEREVLLWNMKQGWMDESLVVRYIRAFLLSPADKEALFRLDLDIADLLNGRYGGDAEPIVTSIFSNWNTVLGEKQFG